MDSPKDTPPAPPHSPRAEGTSLADRSKGSGSVNWFVRKISSGPISENLLAGCFVIVLTYLAFLGPLLQGFRDQSNLINEQSSENKRAAYQARQEAMSAFADHASNAISIAGQMAVLRVETDLYRDLAESAAPTMLLKDERDRWQEYTNMARVFSRESQAKRESLFEAWRQSRKLKGLSSYTLVVFHAGAARAHSKSIKRLEASLRHLTEILDALENLAGHSSHFATVSRLSHVIALAQQDLANQWADSSRDDVTPGQQDDAGSQNETSSKAEPIASAAYQSVSELQAEFQRANKNRYEVATEVDRANRVAEDMISSSLVTMQEVLAGGPFEDPGSAFASFWRSWLFILGTVLVVMALVVTVLLARSWVYIQQQPNRA